MNYNWLPTEVPDERAVIHLAGQLSVLPVVARLLVERGLDSPERAKQFFYSTLQDQHDPFLMSDMGKAVERIVMALERNERGEIRITVFKRNEWT